MRAPPATSESVTGSPRRATESAALTTGTPRNPSEETSTGRARETLFAAQVATGPPKTPR